MSKITKADLVDAIYGKIKMERREIKGVVDLFIGEVKSALVSHKVIELRGFGTFEIKIRKGREKARNPKTGELFFVGSHGVALFKAGRELRRGVWSLQREKPVEGQTLKGQTVERQITEGQTTERYIIDEKTDKSEDRT